jgi:hypothetical protein
MTKKIIILEDNAERRAAMRRCLEDRFYQFETVFFDEVPALTDYLQVHLSETIVISLDHDLELMPHGDGAFADPGTGREAANFLAKTKPVCPVVIHSSNGPAAIGMEMALYGARWKTFRSRRAMTLNGFPRSGFSACDAP